MALAAGFVDNIAGVARVLRGTTLESETIDPKLGSIHTLKSSLGERALEFILLGLSRRITPTREDAEALISQWERRDQSCCFSGSVDDLMSQTGTIAIALSYRHDERENWNRKGHNLVSKMVHEDEQEFIESVVGLGRFPETSSIIVWCDQILSTRIGNVKKGLYAWHNTGLLPYIGLPVLTMSTRIPENLLERRIWIKAERSLGRLGAGLLPISDAKLGILSNFSYSSPWDALRTIALFMLSGYWPADTGFWENDYKDMKTWALAVLCRTNKIIDLRFHADVKPVDNLEILSNFHHLVVIPRGIQHEERPAYTEDRLFFLRTTAWNLSLEDVWSREDRGLSHYLGSKVDHKFSWWIDGASETLCGMLALEAMAFFVLGVRHDKGYKVFRRGVDPSRYRHKEPTAGPETKRLIAETAQKFGITADANAEWRLRYCCDDWADNHMTDAEVQQHMCTSSSEVDAVVPISFVGLTTCLYRASAAIRLSNNAEDVGPREFISHFDEWNSYVKKRYENWISVRDTRSGPVWLEGYNGDCVSFGFLDFLTRRMFAGGRYISDRTIKLPSKWEAIQEIRRAAAVAGDDVKLISKQLFGSILERNCETELRTSEVARLMVCGGFTSDFGRGGLTAFLKKTAQTRGYWSTDIRCRGGEMQIVFENGYGDMRIIQRKTVLDNFSAIGVVTPEDSNGVARKAEVLREYPELYRDSNYWKPYMKSNSSKASVLLGFPRSIRIFHGKCVSLVDMTAGKDVDTDLCSVYEASGWSKRKALTGMAHELMTSIPTQLQENVFKLAASLMSSGKPLPGIPGIPGSDIALRAAINQRLAEMAKPNDDLTARAHAAIAESNRLAREIRVSKQREEGASHWETDSARTMSGRRR